jgi:FKBP-type peptidyl-prolyl cis-trans isomerase SlyD
MSRSFFPLLCAVLLLLPGCRKPDVVAAETVVEITTTEFVPNTDIEAVRKTAQVLIGFQQTSPIIENALMGMKIGETKTVRLKAADGPYGEYNPYAVQEIPKSMVPEGQQIKVGAAFSANTPALAVPVSARIVEVKDKSIIVDFNHPFAGKDLSIAIEVLKIRAATRQELDRVLSTGQELSAP